MSCGKLHEPGHGCDLPASGGAGGGEGYEYVRVGGRGPGPADPDGSAGGQYGVMWEAPGAAVQGAAPAVREPGPVRIAAAGAWARHGYAVKPFCWAGGVDGAAIVVHEMAASRVLGFGPLAAVVTAFLGGLAAEVGTEVRNRRRKRSFAWKTLIRRQIFVATPWAIVAAAWTPFGWEDIVQWIALLGGLSMAWWFGHEVRRARKRDIARQQAEEEWEPLAIDAPRPVDPRLQLFTDRFCQPGEQLYGVFPERFRELAYGFMFEISFPPGERHTRADVEYARVLIAKLYDVTEAAVSVGYVPDNRTEARCQVIVRTVPALTVSQRADPAYNRWDGTTSTWDPATGLIDLGRYLDETITHYRLNAPGSGAAMGMVTGVPGAGKTATMNLIAAKAGLAKLCLRCGPGRACSACDLQRVWAVWMADPQEQGFSVWRGRADLTGWGPEGCLELLEFADAVSAARGDVLSNMDWWDTGPDGRPRRNTGKGWFDPEPGFPGIALGLDELPKLAKYHDQDIARAALEIICNGVMEWRKRGIHPYFGTQSLDLTQIGIREIRELIKFLNSIAHRCDEGTSSMGGVTGDPRLLPEEPGVGYIAGPDGRPGDQFSVEFMPEVLRPGMRGTDIRHVAGVIACTPITYDPGTLAVMAEWGVKHQQVFTEWTGRPEEPKAAAPAVGLAPDPAAGPGIGGLAYREDAERVLEVLRGRPGGTDIVDLMRLTELSLGAVGRSLDTLAANGQVTKNDNDQYTAA